MRRPIAATTVGMLLGCATVASLVAPLASAEDDAPAVASADDSLPNTAPSAVDDDAVVTAGGSVVVDVLANDSDPDG